MMTNLFSIFDPGISIMKITWFISFLVILMMSNKMWKMTNLPKKFLNSIIEMLKKEVAFSMGKTEKSTEIMIMTTFLIISVMNFMALYPQIFSITSHLAFTLPLALMFWSSIVMFGWTKNTNHMMTHLLPQGTPTMLMSFMVMVEMSSNIIRPITLFVRLTANLVAGHLLMSLLGNMLMSLTMKTTAMMMILPAILTILESAVAMIQAYVFMTLITLYTTEVK